MLVLKWKGGAFIEKVNSRCFCWFPAAILVDSFGLFLIWRLHTKLYKGAWNVSATNSETVGHKDLRFGQIVYILVFYNIPFSWLLPLDGFKCIFLCRVYCVTVKTKNTSLPEIKKVIYMARHFNHRRKLIACSSQEPLAYNESLQYPSIAVLLLNSDSFFSTTQQCSLVPK